MQSLSGRRVVIKTNSLTKILIFFILVLLCLVLTLFVLVVKNGLFSKLDKHHCTTADCITSSAQIIELIDAEQDPCQHFYNFVCGNYLKKTLNQPNNEEAFKKNVDYIITKDKNFFGEALEHQRTFYSTCLNVNDNDTETFLDLLEHFSSWPVLKGRLWYEKKFDWLLSIPIAARIGIENDYFLRIRAVETNKNIRLEITPPDPIAIRFDREKYINLMINVSVGLGAYLNHAESEFMRVSQFEEELAAIINDADEVKLIPLKELENIFPMVSWVDFTNNLTRSKTFNLDTVLAVRGRNYLESLAKLMASTPKKVQANYLIWKFVQSYYPFLRKSVREMFHNYYNYKQVDRSNYCLEKSKQLFPTVGEIAFIRKKVSQTTRKEIEQIIEKIKKLLVSKIKSSKWMSKATRNATMKYLKDKINFIGLSNASYNLTASKMEWFVPTENIIEMLTQLIAENHTQQFKFVNQAIGNLLNYTLYTKPILTFAQMENYAQFNALILPFSVLNDYFFHDYRRPNYMNYGAIGSVISHELTHDLINHSKDLWPTQTQDEFESKFKQCLSNGITNKNVNAEDLTDFIAPNLAYEAYRMSLKKDDDDDDYSFSSEYSLVGINYTPSQMFWIMFGALKCYQNKVVPGNDLFMGNLMNSKHFLRDFHCTSHHKIKDVCDVL